MRLFSLREIGFAIFSIHACFQLLSAAFQFKRNWLRHFLYPRLLSTSFSGF
jgi:hypothetical protein